MQLVILARDGVINRITDGGLRNPRDWEPIPGSLRAIARLNQAGYRVVVMCQQPDGAAPDQGLGNAIHQRLQSGLSRVGGHVDAVFICPHVPGLGCDCRPPAPGLYFQLQERLGLPLDGVVAMADNADELRAALAAGATPWLLLSGRGRATRQHLLELGDGDLIDIPVAEDLANAVEQLVVA